MGIDLDHKHRKSGRRKNPESNDPYLRLLVKLYKFLSRRTTSQFNTIVLRRLFMARRHRPPVSLSSLSRKTPKPVSTPKGGEVAIKSPKKELIHVVVGTVTDDERFLKIPKLNVCALRFTKTAKARIVKSGGRALTFDQLALERPTGCHTLLIQGRRHNREACRHFHGLRGRLSAVPYVRKGAKSGRKFERTKHRRR
eukprot:TRINITY_DN86_c0_g1_i4.p1 TRINITY_DN86_c0_g1~~TRINITY_DN86_c0_g1_i4.p1  ORF type:complete len:197 (-),score=26.44 TRINITY_DN86_c0_g1_i4:92-682(-)